MVSKIALLIPMIVIAAIVGAIGLSLFPLKIKDKSLEFARGKVGIDNDLINVEVAKSNAEKQRWLMFRHEKLPLNSAMILVYDKPDLYSMWLLNIEYNLDLIWFDENGHVVYIVKDASPCKNALDPSSCTYKNTKAAKYVIAATSGFIDKHKISNESKMTMISIYNLI
jgi:uncharacterized protein